MMEIMCLYLHQMPEQEIRIAMASTNKDGFNSFIHEITQYCFDKTCQRFPQFRLKQALLTDGKIKEEIKRAIGKIQRVSSTQPATTTGLPGFESRVQLIQELYSQMKGKSKAPVPQIAPPHEATVVQAEASQQQDVSLYTPPTLHLLRQQNITFIPAARLGQGAFAFVCKVKVDDEAFKDEVYAAKCMLRGDGIMTRDLLACHEATSVPLSHRGIIRPLALVRDPNRPMVIYQFWNGGHLEHWIQILNSKGGRPMGQDFVDTLGTPDIFIEYIFHIINGLLQTLEFMHYHNFGHNDLHGRNILIHFGVEVYVGLADWGRAANYPTDTCFPKFRNSEERRAKRLQYKHVAPECFVENPPTYSKKQEVYSISYHIDRLLRLLPTTHNREYQAFVSHLSRWASRGMSESIDARPDIFDIICAMSSAHKYHIDIVKTSGLRPFHE